MTKLVGTRVIQPIVPNDSADVYPTHKDEYGKGGYRSVETIAERDSIRIERQKLGMAVYVIETGELFVQLSYSRNLSDENWGELQLGNNGTSVIASPQPPPNPQIGIFWLNTLTGRIFIYTHEYEWEEMVYKSVIASQSGDIVVEGGTF